VQQAAELIALARAEPGGQDRLDRLDARSQAGELVTSGGSELQDVSTAIVFVALAFDQATPCHAGDEISDGGAVEVKCASEVALAGPRPLIKDGEHGELDAGGFRADVAQPDGDVQLLGASEQMAGVA
jgi:hypothetical protein